MWVNVLIGFEITEGSQNHSLCRLRAGILFSPRRAQARKHDYPNKAHSRAPCWLLQSMELALSLSGAGGKEKTQPRLSWNYSWCLLTWAPGPTDAVNKERLLHWDPCHQSGFRIIFNSRLGVLAVVREWLGGKVSRGREWRSTMLLTAIHHPRKCFNSHYPIWDFLVSYTHLSWVSTVHIALTLRSSAKTLVQGYVYEDDFVLAERNSPTWAEVIVPFHCSIPSYLLWEQQNFPMLLKRKKKMWGWSHELVPLSKSS